jgi:hypothetical protein
VREGATQIPGGGVSPKNGLTGARALRAGLCHDRLKERREACIRICKGERVKGEVREGAETLWATVRTCLLF